MKDHYNISAKVVADSISNGIRITTLQLHYPRFIHAEFMTHRLFSRNASSSRAIPITSVIDQVTQSPATPEHWGKNQSGMQAKHELDIPARARSQQEWMLALDSAVEHAKKLQEFGCHKQIVNRILEPFQHINVIMTATELTNFFWLRNHEDAQPEIKILAERMQEAVDASTPVKLKFGEWHLPFVSTYRDQFGEFLWYFDENGEDISLEEAQKISASACAQVSYRKNDLSLEKAAMIWDRLIFSEPCHASPVEHQATPMLYTEAKHYDSPEAWQPGTTHMTANGELWSGNFRGWVQHRKLLTNESKW